MIARDREAAAVEALVTTLAGVRCEIRHGQIGGAACANCLSWARTIGAPLWTPVIAAGWVPQSEVAEWERAAAEKALRDAADAMQAGAVGSASHWRAHGWANWLRARADRLAGGAS